MSWSCHINLPGGQLVTNHIVRRVPLKLQGRNFHTSLIILPTQKVDIILGMNWMEDQGILLDTLSQSVHIKFSPHGSMTLHLMDYGSLTHAVNQVEGKTLADIPVVCEYSDVFPDDLPGPLIARLNLQLNCNRERHQFPEDLIGCHPMN